MTDYLSRQEKNRLPPMAAHDITKTPHPDDPVRMGRAEINNDLCNGCKLCVLVCPAQSLTMTGKNSVGMIGDSAACIGCGDCMPICHPGAITLVRFMEYDGLYKFVGRGAASPPRRF
jgi:ferredoxin